MRRKGWMGAALAAVVVLSLFYARFASRQIYRESVSRLEEVYGQVNAALRSTISKNWRLLRSWQPYIAAETDPAALADFLLEEGEAWHFTAFYFLAPDGSYVTGQGETGRMALAGLDLSDTASEVQSPDGRRLALFTVPAEPGTYRGFAYAAVGFAFPAEDMSGGLRVETFSDQSRCFVVLPGGQVLFSSHSGPDAPSNLLDDLRRRGSFSGMEPEDVARDWQRGERLTTMCRLDGRAHYLTYQPVGFSGWMLVSAAPADVVNAGMSRFSLVTLTVMALLFGILTLGAVTASVHTSRRRVWEQDREIRSREELFDLLTENTEDIFVLFSPRRAFTPSTSAPIWTGFWAWTRRRSGPTRAPSSSAGRRSGSPAPPPSSPPRSSPLCPWAGCGPGSGTFSTPGPRSCAGSSSCSTTAPWRTRTSSSSCSPTAPRSGRCMRPWGRPSTPPRPPTRPRATSCPTCPTTSAPP